jgi:hypothetical protein
VNEFVRHRVVQAASPAILQLQVAKLLQQGWRVIGEPALATPMNLASRPYWVQAMYLAPNEVPQDAVKFEIQPGQSAPPQGAFSAG